MKIQSFKGYKIIKINKNLINGDGLMKKIELKEISEADARSIILNRKPLGTFWLKEKNLYVGIDNDTGDAWTESFDTKEQCVEWLLNKSVVAHPECEPFGEC
jgi:hypothetical protein